MAKQKRNPLDLALAAIAVGMLIMIVGAVDVAHQYAFSRQAVTTTATVVGYQETACSRARRCTRYYPATVEFTTTDGRHIRTTLSKTHNRDIPTNGTVLSIQYRRDHPEIAQASEDQATNWALPSILAGVGFIVLIGGATVMIVRSHRRPQATAK